MLGPDDLVWNQPMALTAVHGRPHDMQRSTTDAASPADRV